MLNEQLLAYVRDNVKAGFQRTDIEVALRASGWDAADIAAAFTTVTGSAAAPDAKTAQINSKASAEQQSIDAEVARIQAEIKTTSKKKSYETEETGIIGWMIRHNLASTKQRANMILISLTVVMLALALWIAFR